MTTCTGLDWLVRNAGPAIARMLTSMAGLAVLLLAPAPALAEGISLTNITPIVAGGDPNGTPPDSPAHRVDPNVSTSPYAGVVALRSQDGLFVGSGVAISPFHILTGYHVVYPFVTDGQPFNVFVNASGPSSQVIAAAGVTVQPSAGAVAPNFADGTWIYNDLAIVTLAAPLAADVPIYGLYENNPTLLQTTGATLTLVGYGEVGDGINGYSPNTFDINTKRVGFNKLDVIQSNPNGIDPDGRLARIYIYDFDGPTLSTNQFGPNIPTNGTLGNTIEATLGRGDSGGPAFFDDGGILKIVGINVFVGSVSGGPVPPLFGSIGGGPLVFDYRDWIADVIAVPEPTSLAGLATAATALGVLAVSRRRHRRAA